MSLRYFILNIIRHFESHTVLVDSFWIYVWYIYHTCRTYYPVLFCWIDTLPKKAFTVRDTMCGTCVSSTAYSSESILSIYCSWYRQVFSFECDSLLCGLSLSRLYFWTWCCLFYWTYDFQTDWYLLYLFTTYPCTATSNHKALKSPENYIVFCYYLQFQCLMLTHQLSSNKTIIKL